MFNNNSSGGESQPSSGAVGEKTCVESTPQNSNPQASEPAMGVIYRITCLVNGKFYIGKTKRNLKRRIIEHKRDSSRGRPGIDAAIHKYGWDGNFTVEIIETCPVEKLGEREIFWIAELNSKSPNGYNLTDGGDGGRGLSPNKETRDKISAKLKGRPAHNKGVKATDEARANMSAAQKAIGNKPPNHKGKKRGPRSPETKAKLSVANTGRKHTPEELAKMSASQKARWAKKKLENGGK